MPTISARPGRTAALYGETWNSRCRSSPIPMIRSAKKLLAEAGYPNGFDAGDLYAVPPYFAIGEAIVGYLGAIGIRTRLRTMERAAYFSALQSKKLKGVCFCGAGATYGNASTRMSVIVPSDG